MTVILLTVAAFTLIALFLAAAFIYASRAEIAHNEAERRHDNLRGPCNVEGCHICGGPRWM